MHLSRVCRIVLIVTVLTLTACTAGERLLPSPAGPTPTPLPPEPAIEQPTYEVRRGDVIRELDFTARVAAEQEARLFFRADGHL